MCARLAKYNIGLLFQSVITMSLFVSFFKIDLAKLNCSIHFAPVSHRTIKLLVMIQPIASGIVSLLIFAFVYNSCTIPPFPESKANEPGQPRNGESLACAATPSDNAPSVERQLLTLKRLSQ